MKNSKTLCKTAICFQVNSKQFHLCPASHNEFDMNQLVFHHHYFINTN